MAELLIDTDVFIDHLRGAHRLEARNHRLSYSVITRAELFAGQHVDEALVAQLLAPCQEIRVDRAIAERAGRIRRATGTRMLDALIAATALMHNLVLVTRNVRHFANVPDLQVQAPSDR